MRAIFLLGIIAVLGLAGFAGCVAPDAKGPTSPSQALDLLTGPAFATVKVGFGADTETSIITGPDGHTILACTHGGFSQPSPVWSSADNGATWKRLTIQPNPVVSGDCDVAITSDGIWAVIFDTIASSTVATSRDQGASWSFAYTAAIPFGGVDRPWIVADGTTLVIAYANVMATEPAINTVALSHDGGKTWTEHHTASALGGTADFNHIIGKPIVHGSVIRLPVAGANLETGGPTSLFYATSRDSGQTWKREDTVPAFDGQFVLPASTQAADGTLYWSQPVQNGDTTSVRAYWSTDDGKTWSKPITVKDNVTFAGGAAGVSSAWIDARPDGSATLAWYELTKEGRQAWWARIDAKAAQPVLWVAAAGNATKDTSSYEFIMLDHDLAGRAHFTYPLKTDATCAQPDRAMSGRSLQCLFAVNET